MGLFSDKVKYEVNMTLTNVFTEDNIPNSAQLGTIKAVMQDGNIKDYILEGLSSSIGVRAMSGYAWAQEHYGLGIPSGGVRSYIDAEAVVKQAIEANIGRPITLQYYRLAPINSMHFGWQYCFDAMGYDPLTNELKLTSAAVGKPCYLANIVATYRKENYDWMVETSDMGMLDQLGPAPTSGYLPSKPFNVLGSIGQYAAQPEYQVSSVATEDYVTITYEFEDSPGVFVQRGITVTMSIFEDIADFHQARYVDNTGKTGFFTYKQGIGTYPLVDAALRIEHTGLGTYFPWVYYRVQQQSVDVVLSQARIREMIRWCSYLGVEWTSMWDNIHQDPEVGDVEQIIQLFGCYPGSQHQSELEYLFRYFDAMHANSLSQRKLAQDLYGQMNAFTSSPSQFQAIQDKQFRMDFQYSGIVKARRTGKVTSVGKYTGAYRLVRQNAQTFASQDGGGAGTGTAISSQPAYVYQYQVNDTVYEEVAVYNLRMNYLVHAKKGLAAGPGDSRLLIPIDTAIVSVMSLSAREDLMCRSLKLMVNTVTKITQPWYTSGFWKSAMLVVAVVITIMSLGTAWQSIVAASALGTTAIVITIATLIVQALVVTVAVKLFIQQFGPQIGILAAVLGMALGYYASTQGKTWGDALIAISNNLVKEAGSAVQDMITNIRQEFESLQLIAMGAADSLEDMKEQLGLNQVIAGLEPMDIVRYGPGFIPGEEPQDYYTRTIHSGNIGTVGYDAIEYFVDAKLTLPRLSENAAYDEENDDGLAI